MCQVVGTHADPQFVFAALATALQRLLWAMVVVGMLVGTSLSHDFDRTGVHVGNRPMQSWRWAGKACKDDMTANLGTEHLLMAAMRHCCCVWDL